jgi:hypothetical protein
MNVTKSKENYFLIKSKNMKDNKNQQSMTYNIREERLKASQEKKLKVDEVMENAKKHFEEIFNRI